MHALLEMGNRKERRTQKIQGIFPKVPFWHIDRDAVRYCIDKAVRNAPLLGVGEKKAAKDVHYHN